MVNSGSRSWIKKRLPVGLEIANSRADSRIEQRCVAAGAPRATIRPTGEA
jgi:hypothetical protein